MIEVDPGRMLDDLKQLAQFGKSGPGVNRRALTTSDIAARQWLVQRMVDAGLEARIDGIGSVIGRTPNANKYIVIGSHTDSVPNGGWLDGAMGVIYGLEIARACVESSPASDIGVEVVSFMDEEGRFSGLLGSSVYCGLTSVEEILDSSADDGSKFHDALKNAGFDNESVATLDTGRHAAYLEAHIEQGPVLESERKKIGIVTDIVGARRIAVTFTGQADHAGTTPMQLRKDAAAAAFAFAVRFREFCNLHGGDTTVWNIGNVLVTPGAYNVVALEATLSLEFRDRDAAVLDKIDEQIWQLASEIAEDYRVTPAVVPGVNSPPAAMHSALIRRVAGSAERLGAPNMHMPSGAGHDAMHFADLIPTGMLFVPSRDGRSHDTAEDTDEADIALGLQVLADVVRGILDDGAP